MDMNALELQELAIDPSEIFTPSRDVDGGFGLPYSMTGSDDTEEEEDDDDEDDEDEDEDDDEGEGEGEGEGQ